MLVLLDEKDRVVYRERLPNDLQLVLKDLETYRDAIEGLVVESTDNCYWLVDGLMDAGYRVHLAKTAAIVQYSFLRLCAMPFRDMGNGTGNVQGFDLQTQASGLRTPDP